MGSKNLFTVNVIRQMAPLLSKIDSNKLLCDIQNEETVISAKYGKDLLNISKVIGRKTKWPRFLAYPVDQIVPAWKVRVWKKLTFGIGFGAHIWWALRTLTSHSHVGVDRQN